MEVKDETALRYAQAEIQTQVVVMCDPTHYQLYHGGAPEYIHRNVYSLIMYSTGRSYSSIHLYMVFLITMSILFVQKFYEIISNNV